MVSMVKEVIQTATDFDKSVVQVFGVAEKTRTPKITALQSHDLRDIDPDVFGVVSVVLGLGFIPAVLTAMATYQLPAIFTMFL